MLDYETDKNAIAHCIQKLMNWPSAFVVRFITPAIAVIIGIFGYLDLPMASEQQMLGCTTLSSTHVNNCYCLGPFSAKSEFELAKAVLSNANIVYRGLIDKKLQKQMYRIYLGPYATREETRIARNQLKRNRIDEHFTLDNELGGYIISLGVYSTEQASSREASKISRIQDGVKTRQESIALGEVFWLELPHELSADNMSLLRRVDWQKKSVKLQRCRTG